MCILLTWWNLYQVNFIDLMKSHHFPCKYWTGPGKELSVVNELSVKELRLINLMAKVLGYGETGFRLWSIPSVQTPSNSCGQDSISPTQLYTILPRGPETWKWRHALFNELKGLVHHWMAVNPGCSREAFGLDFHNWSVASDGIIFSKGLRTQKFLSFSGT